LRDLAGRSHAEPLEHALADVIPGLRAPAHVEYPPPNGVCVDIGFACDPVFWTRQRKLALDFLGEREAD